MKPSEIASALAPLAGIVGLPAGAVAAIPAALAALGILEEAVASDPDMASKLDEAIARASSRNRSGDVAADLQAELDALTGAKPFSGIFGSEDKTANPHPEMLADTDPPPPPEAAE